LFATLAACVLPLAAQAQAKEQAGARGVRAVRAQIRPGERYYANWTRARSRLRMRMHRARLGRAVDAARL